MNTKSKVIFTSIICVILLIIITTSLITLFMPKRLVDLIDLDQIDKAYAVRKTISISKEGKVNSKVIPIVRIREFKNFISTAIYKNRYNNVENTDKMYIKIIYKNGDEIIMDTFSYLKKDKDGTILKQKKIKCDINYKEFYE